MARRALILANGAYADATIPALASPVSDARRLKALLEREEVGGYQVELCLDAATMPARLAVHDFFEQARPGDLHLMVYSGHGLKDARSRLYFATADTQRERLAATALSASFIRQQMDDSRAGQKVLFIDACYSGTFIEGMTPKRAGADQVSAQDFGNTQDKGTAIVTATTSVQVAGEREFDGTVQSVFTRCLIEGIESGAADSTGNGTITLGELFDYIKERMRSEAPSQTPHVLSLGSGGSMALARSPARQAAVLPKSLLTRVRSKDRARRISAAEDLEALAMPGSAQAALALEQLHKLAQDDSLAVRSFAKAALARLGEGSISQAEPVDPVPPEPREGFAAEPKTGGEPGTGSLSQSASDDNAPTVRDRKPGKVSCGFVLAVMLVSAVVTLGAMRLFGSDEESEPTAIGQSDRPIAAAADAMAPASLQPGDWLTGYWYIDIARLGCANPMIVRYDGGRTLNVAVGGAAKDYLFHAEDYGRRFVTEPFTFIRNGDRVTVQGKAERFELSRCNTEVAK